MAAILTNLYNNFNLGSAVPNTGALSFTAGRLVLATAQGRHDASGALTVSCADSAGNTWGDFGLIVSGIAIDNTFAYQQTFYTIANASGPSTITMTWSGVPTRYTQIIVDDASGVIWTAPVGDVQGSGTGASVPATIQTTGTSSDTAQANELVYVSVHAGNAGSFTLAGYTSVVNDLTTLTAFKEVTAIQPAGTAVVVTVTTTAAGVPYTMQLMTFKEPSGGSTPPDTNTIFRALSM